VLHEDIRNWIFETLSVPNPIFNNLPACPYAGQAYNQKQVLVIESLCDIDFIQLLNEYEVIIYATDPKKITAEQLFNLSQTISNKTIVALDDHPDHEEKVGDVILNNGKYALLLIQNRKKLEHARKILKHKGYYKNWDEEYLDEVLSL